MNKKADANMWWIIIGAVIALVVLIVLLVIFTSKSGKLEGGLLDCASKGGTCVSKLGDGTADCKNPDGKDATVATAFDCPIKEQVCCFKSK